MTIVDPAMADHGRLYKGFDERYASAVKELCAQATSETGVKVLLGVEANILGLSGKTDMKEADMEIASDFLEIQASTIDLFPFFRCALVEKGNYFRRERRR